MRRATSLLSRARDRRSATNLSSTTSPSPSSPPQKPPPSLTAGELAEINALIPRLCDANHHHEAIRLLDACLLTSPPLSSLPLPTLTSRLAAHPDMSPAMALLTALRHHPRRPSPLPFCSLLLSAYLHNRRLKEAAKIFAWLCRSDSPCRPDVEFYRTAVTGFCRHGRVIEGLRAMREMLRDGIAPGKEMRVAVYRSLMYEARVDEARELDDALEGGGDGLSGVGEVIGRIIRQWEEF